MTHLLMKLEIHVGLMRQHLMTRGEPPKGFRRCCFVFGKRATVWKPTADSASGPWVDEELKKKFWLKEMRQKRRQISLAAACLPGKHVERSPTT